MKYNCGPEGKKIDLDISLPEGKGKKILFALSGGADSAILLYILAKMNKEAGTEHQVIPFTIPRPDGGANYSPGIAEWINKALDVNIPMPMVVGDGNLPHQIVVKRAVMDLLDTNQYDVLYIAENRVPDHAEGLLPTRAPTNNYKRVKMPFWAITKDYVMDLYFIENIPDLLLISHSCTEQTIGRCGICFQCTERRWAFESIGKSDTGVL